MEKKKVVEQENKEHSYFYSLELEGINCFKDKQTLDLSDGNGNYSPWTIILGDNGTGKTTLLRVLDRMQPVEATHENQLFSNPKFAFEFILSNSKIDNSNAKLFIKKNDSNAFLSLRLKDGIAKMLGYKEVNSFLISYGASRRMSKSTSLSQLEESKNKITSLFDESIDLINSEEWYLQKYLAFSTSESGIKIKLKQQLDLISKILIDFLPDVLGIRIKEIKTLIEKASLEVKINENEWINLRDLSFGYQTLTALIVDIASKMMEQYPNSDNPLEEPAIILIDEIDLHLHPKWQRTVINKLSEHFPKAQFIATSHSPLIVQAALDKKANIVVCRKEGDKVIIDNDPDEVKGWRIDQILISDLFEVESPRSKTTQEMLDEYVILKGKSKLTKKDKEKIEELAPNIEKAYPNSTSDLDDKLSKFAEKYLK
ncbi:MAG: AAA family ATPase [Flavobacterium sp.]|uniref:AAA family ATPase n=1 Tax=Flavobacterium sp. TaxID=239 RepID=UPI00261367A0|nr:AAA family ATPase [Flavobacterium sp.]MDD5149142.1 AAA family ATPase [Flavobacterium sp.]